MNHRTISTIIASCSRRTPNASDDTAAQAIIDIVARALHPAVSGMRTGDDLARALSQLDGLDLPDLAIEQIAGRASLPTSAARELDSAAALGWLLALSTRDGSHFGRQSFPWPWLGLGDDAAWSMEGALAELAELLTDEHRAALELLADREGYSDTQRRALVL